MNIIVFLALLYIWGLAIYNDPTPKTIVTIIIVLGFMMWNFGVELKVSTMREIIVAIGFIAIYYIHPMFST